MMQWSTSALFVRSSKEDSLLGLGLRCYHSSECSRSLLLPLPESILLALFMSSPEALFLRIRLKEEICLVTCIVTRAVHLEVVPDLTTAAFLRYLKCVITQRPSQDHQCNDVAWGDATVSGVGVRLPRAPCWGGVFEHMTKKKIAGRARLSLDDFTTLVTEVEGGIN